MNARIKSEFKKIGKEIPFTFWEKNPQQILCQKKKPRLLPNSQPGVYQLGYSCIVKYIGKSKTRVLTRGIEHQQDNMSGKWELSGATEHTKEFQGEFDLLHSKTVRFLPYMCERKTREVLEMNKLRTTNEKEKTFTISNRQNCDYVLTNSWKPLFMKSNNH